MSHNKDSRNFLSPWFPHRFFTSLNTQANLKPQTFVCVESRYLAPVQINYFFDQGKT